MGFFSWNCLACGHSIRASHCALSGLSGLMMGERQKVKMRNLRSWWMSDVVALMPEGIVRGIYDGYGRIIVHESEEIEQERLQTMLLMQDANPTDFDKYQKLREAFEKGEKITIPHGDPARFYHYDCWTLTGSPKVAKKASRRADDQGFFATTFPPTPRTKAAVAKLLERTVERDKKADAAAARATARDAKAAEKEAGRKSPARP